MFKDNKAFKLDFANYAKPLNLNVGNIMTILYKTRGYRYNSCRQVSSIIVSSSLFYYTRLEVIDTILVDR